MVRGLAALMFAAVFVLVPRLARADFTATYDFAGVSTSSGLVDPSAVPVVANLTLGSFSATGTPTNPNAAGRFSFTAWPTGATNGNDAYGSLTGAINAGQYYAVTLTPQAGYALNLTSLTFTVQRSGTGIRTYAVRSDAASNAFATNLPASINPANTNLSVQPGNVFFWVPDSQTGAQNGSTVTLTGAAFQNVTTPVTFRFYGWNAEAGTGTFSIDNVVFNGNVVSSGGPTPPSIATPPSSQTVTAGTNVLFSVIAGGTAPFTYQWYKGVAALEDGGTVGGVHTDTLSLGSVQVGDSGDYSVVVTNAGGSIPSPAATLTVNPLLMAPSITTPPLPQSVSEGGTATFTVGASGSAPLSYQWRRNGANLSDNGIVSGATTSTLTIYPVAAADAGNYDVVVSNSVNPPAESTPVALTVTPPAPVLASATWNFSAGSAAAVTPGSPDVAGSEVSRGNNFGSGNTLVNTTSASGVYAGASGTFNAGAAAKTGALDLVAGTGSAYFEFTLTPADNKQYTPTAISFGSRSTGTGPQAWTLYSSADGFTSSIASGSLTNNSTWALKTATLSGITTGTGLDITFRLYGSNGSGNAGSGTTNWRIDDLLVSGTAAVGVPVPPAVTAVVPANGATGVLPNAVVNVTFNRSVLVSPASFVLTGSTSGAHTVAVTGGPKTFVLTPATPFALGETVTLTVLAANVSSLSGALHPAADFNASFTTLSPIPVPIHEVQGSGLASPKAGQALVVQGIVVATFQGANGVGGYYVEAPQAEWDADDATSEGILVFDNANSVTVGDEVYVAGSVVEFGSGSATETELSPVYVFNKLSTGNALPPALEVTLPFPVAGHAERYEGMLVTLPQTLTVTDNFDLGHFGEVVLSNGRLPQPTNIVAPGAPAQAQLAANLLNQVMLDDGVSPPYPDPTPYLSGADAASATRRTGSTATGVTGAFGHKFGFYVVEPTAPVVFAESNPRPTETPASGSGLRVAIGNVLNFFNGDGAGGGFPTDRGADTFAEYQAQRAKIVAGILGLAPDIMGLTEVENDKRTGSASSYDAASALADLVNGLNASAPSGTTYAYVDAAAVDIVSDVIHCAFIYRVETVAPVGAAAMLDHPSFIGVNIGIARNPLAQTFQQLSNGEKLTVSINHFKSKGSATADAGGGGAAANADSGDGQGASNHVRKLQAQALVDWLATDPTNSGDPDFLIIGDLNAYAKEDPIAIIEGAGYINLTEAAEGEGGYSYSFDGAFGHLDHALANAHLAGQVVDAVTWHVNADEPIYLDYNAENKSAAQLLVNAGTPYRYSDHDPVVVRLNLQPDPVAPVITDSPVTQVTITGAGITFSVTATGVPPPAYQWRHNGEDIDGATSSTYTIASPTSADAGLYDVVVTNSAGTATSAPATLTVNPAPASVTLTDLSHVYDGQPHPATATTSPAGLPVTITYNGGAALPVAPGWYTVAATINSPDYTGAATAQLFIDVTALVRHLPTLDGKVNGSVQLVTHENATLNSNGWITGDLLVPGTPVVVLNGQPVYGGTIDGTGAATPATARITLNNGAKLGHVVRRSNGLTLPTVSAPPAPTGTRNVALSSAAQSVGDFATIRNLTLNSGNVVLAVPPGTYGVFTANSNSRFVLGVAGATEPAVYNLQGLVLNGASRLVIVGPVTINLASGASFNASVDTGGHPEWLQLNLAAGNLVLNANVSFAGCVTAPSGTVAIQSGAVLTGRIIADRLVVNGSGQLVDPDL